MATSPAPSGGRCSAAPPMAPGSCWASRRSSGATAPSTAGPSVAVMARPDGRPPSAASPMAVSRKVVSRLASRRSLRLAYNCRQAREVHMGGGHRWHKAQSPLDARLPTHMMIFTRHAHVVFTAMGRAWGRGRTVYAYASTPPAAANRTISRACTPASPDHYCRAGTRACIRRTVSGRRLSR